MKKKLKRELSATQKREIRIREYAEHLKHADAIYIDNNCIFLQQAGGTTLAEVCGSDIAYLLGYIMGKPVGMA